MNEFFGILGTNWKHMSWKKCACIKQKHLQVPQKKTVCSMRTSPPFKLVSADRLHVEQSKGSWVCASGGSLHVLCNFTRIINLGRGFNPWPGSVFDSSLYNNSFADNCTPPTTQLCREAKLHYYKCSLGKQENNLRTSCPCSTCLQLHKAWCHILLYERSMGAGK